MPQYNFSLINMRRTQTTPEVLFRQGKMAGNPGIYPNPLIGWRKQRDCSCNNRIWQEVFKNNCCQPVSKRIQNKNGKIDAGYSYTRQGYLQSNCRTYNQNAFNFDISHNFALPVSCLNQCQTPPGNHVSTYKRNNPQFSKQGAVSSRARLNRLKYNTIMSSMPANQIYWGGQTANKRILQSKSKNKCFCGPTRFAPCRGQNQPCGS